VSGGQPLHHGHGRIAIGQIALGGVGIGQRGGQGFGLGAALAIMDDDAPARGGKGAGHAGADPLAPPVMRTVWVCMALGWRILHVGARGRGPRAIQIGALYGPCVSRHAGGRALAWQVKGYFA
jgi:hypothetical protein